MMNPLKREPATDHLHRELPHRWQRWRAERDDLALRPDDLIDTLPARNDTDRPGENRS